MKKNSIAKQVVTKPRNRKASKARQQNNVGAVQQVVGLDLGDKSSRFCIVDKAGEVLAERGVATTRQGLKQAFGKIPRSRIALEVGTHSPWVSRLLQNLGHEVIVANARRVRIISQSSRKDDRMDAQMLARLARVDPALLYPIRHRGERAQEHLAMIKARAGLVDSRTALVNTARGLTKSFGERIGKCDADQLRVDKIKDLPAGIQSALQPLVTVIEGMTEQIQGYDQELAKIARKEYPESALLEQVAGVGLLIALTFILTLDDAQRFRYSRDVGCFLGLRPKRHESGESQPQLGITKEGDVYLRRLLVQGAHYILSARGPDTDLKRWGRKLAGRGDKRAKKRAVVAVARKLAVLLHHLWVSGEAYEPLGHNSAPRQARSAAA